MAGRKARYYPRCGGRNRGNGLPCQAAGIYPTWRCRWHGGMSTPYYTRPISPEGKERIAASMRAYWARVRSGEVIRPATSKREPVTTPEAWRRLPPETAEARRERIVADLRRRFPDGGF